MENINLYHVTTARNWGHIQDKGRMVPKIGPRSQKLGEDSRLIYFFKSESEAEDGVMNWLGDNFADDERLVLLKVTMPNDSHCHRNVGQFEVTYDQPIGLESIQCVHDEF